MYICRGGHRSPMNLPPSSSSPALLNLLTDSKSIFSRAKFRRLLDKWRHNSIRTLSTRQGKNLYEVLGIPPTASQAEIKKAYYTLSKKYHPDVTGSNASCAKKYLEIKEAYDILRDEKQRVEHDRWLAAAESHRQRMATADRHPFEGRKHRMYNEWPNNWTSRNFFDEEMQRVWRTMNGNAEFKQSQREFDEAVRRKRRMAYEEQLRKRSEWARNGYNNDKEDWTTQNPTRLIGKLILVYVLASVFIEIFRYFQQPSIFIPMDQEEYRRRKIEQMTRRMP